MHGGFMAFIMEAYIKASPRIMDIPNHIVIIELLLGKDFL